VRDRPAKRGEPELQKDPEYLKGRPAPCCTGLRCCESFCHPCPKLTAWPLAVGIVPPHENGPVLVSFSSRGGRAAPPIIAAYMSEVEHVRRGNLRSPGSCHAGSDDGPGGGEIDGELRRPPAGGD